MEIMRRFKNYFQNFNWFFISLLNKFKAKEFIVKTEKENNFLAVKNLRITTKINFTYFYIFPLGYFWP